MKHQLCSECSMVLVYSHGTYQGETAIMKPKFCPYCASPLDLTALEFTDKDQCTTQDLRQRIRQAIAQGHEMMANHDEGNVFSVLNIHTRFIGMIERELEKGEPK